MNYDKIIDQVLAEAYFSSPYEKATGIKRHVGTPIKEAEEDSEFRQTKSRKMLAMHAATAQAIEEWEEKGYQPGDTEGKAFLLNRWIALLVDQDSLTMPGDLFTEDDFIRGLHALGHGTGISGEETGAQLKYHHKRKWGPGGEGEAPNSVADSDPRFKPIMSLPGFMGFLRKAEAKLKDKLNLGKMRSADAVDINTNEDELADARIQLKKDLEASRARKHITL